MEKRPEEKDSTVVLTTRPFRVDLGSINSVAVGRLAARWWWVVALPLLVFLAVGVYVDTRWLYLIPISACLIMPFFGVMAFVAQTSTPRMAQSTRPHYLEIRGDGIEVVPVEDGVSPDSRTAYFITSGEVDDVSVSGKNVVVHLRDRSFMLIRRDAVDDETALLEAVEALL